MRLHERTTAVRDAGGKSLVAFLTAGYPDERTFSELVGACDDAGCDVIEIGVPFSDPIADGPAIQASSAAALEGGMTLPRTLELIGELSPGVDSALVVMSYVNPILRLGLDRFVATAAQVGVAGTIFPDISIEESGEIKAAVRAGGIDYVDLLAPTSGPERIARAADGASGFLYLVSVTGVTGARPALDRDLDAFIARVRTATKLPLYVGFGVSTPEQAAGVAKTADGVIIGSRLVRLIEEADSATDAVSRVSGFLTEVRAAIDAATTGNS